MQQNKHKFYKSTRHRMYDTAAESRLTPWIQQIPITFQPKQTKKYSGD